MYIKEFIKNNIRLSYGCPKTEKQVNRFLNNFDFENEEYLTDISEIDLDLCWIEAISENKSTNTEFSLSTEYRGGYSFYKYITEKAKEYNYDPFKIKEAIINYKITEQYCEEDLKQHIIDKNIQYRLIYSFVRPEIEPGLICIDANKKCLIYPENIEVDLGNVDINNIAYDKAYINELCSFIITPKNYMGNFKLYKIYRSLMGYEEYNPYGKLFGNNTSNTIEEANHTKESDKADSVEYANKSGESNTSNIADGSNKADQANESNIANKVTDNVLNEAAEYIIKNRSKDLTNRIIEIRRNEKWNYSPKPYPDKINIRDIYSTEAYIDAYDRLDEKHSLLILGSTGDGKSMMAGLLAKELTGIDIDVNKKGRYDRVCITDSMSGTLYKNDSNSTMPGELDVFIKYIKDNQIKEPCVLICDEIQRVDACYLLGSLWNKLSGSKSLKEIDGIPDNLYIIFTGCQNSDFCIDGQTTRRLETVEIEYLGKDKNNKNNDRHKKIINAYGKKIENILSAVENVNIAAGTSIIPFSLFLKLVNGEGKSEIETLTSKNYTDNIKAKLKELLGVL